MTIKNLFRKLEKNIEFIHLFQSKIYCNYSNNIFAIYKFDIENDFRITKSKRFNDIYYGEYSFIRKNYQNLTTLEPNNNYEIINMYKSMFLFLYKQN